MDYGLKVNTNTNKISNHQLSPVAQKMLLKILLFVAPKFSIRKGQKKTTPKIGAA